MKYLLLFASLFTLVFVISITGGCLNSGTNVHTGAVPSTTPVPGLVPVEATPSTPIPTFEGVSYNGNLISPQPTKIPETIPAGPDPIIGTWVAQNIPYNCDVVFAQDNSGILSCGPLGIMSFGISWQNTGYDSFGNETYQIQTTSGNTFTSTATVNNSGYMTSSILPVEGYLTKVVG